RREQLQIMSNALIGVGVKNADHEIGEENDAEKDGETGGLKGKTQPPIIARQIARPVAMEFGERRVNDAPLHRFDDGACTDDPDRGDRKKRKGVKIKQPAENELVAALNEKAEGRGDDQPFAVGEDLAE